jgi:hypothetical protein
MPRIHSGGVSVREEVHSDRESKQESVSPGGRFHSIVRVGLGYEFHEFNPCIGVISTTSPRGE